MADKEVLREFSGYWHIPKDKRMEEFEQGIAYRAVLEAKKYVNRKYGGNIPSSKVILDEYYNHFTKKDETVASLIDMYLLIAIKEFQDNPNMIFKIFEEVKDLKSFWNKTSEETYKYTASIKDNRRVLAYDIFHNYDDPNGGKFNKDKMLSVEGYEKEKLIKYINELLEDIRKGITKSLKISYINALSNSINILEQLGILPDYIRKNNMDRQAMNLEILSFDFNEDKKSDKYAVKQLMDPEFLEKLPFEKLVLLYGFYSNRLKKVANSLGLGLFICQKMGDFDINNKQSHTPKVMEAYLQYNAIDRLYEMATNKMYEDLKKYEDKNLYKGKKYVAVSCGKVYSEFIEKFEDAYSAYSGGKSSLRYDFDTYFSTQVVDYFQKDVSVETLLIIAIQHFQKVNWGYIPETKNGSNSIKRNKEKILLGFDVDGFNMPLRLHMPLEKVKNFFNNFDKTYNIPNYIGNEDMEVWDKNMGTSLLMPLSPKHRKQVISFVKSMNPKSSYYGFARHIQCMQYENSLSRLERWKDPNGRKAVRTYTNLLTGEEVVLARGK